MTIDHSGYNNNLDSRKNHPMMRCRHIVQRFNEDLALAGEMGLTEADMEILCREVFPYPTAETKLETQVKIVRNYFYDGPLLAALNNPDHPDHESQWRQLQRWCLAVTRQFVGDQRYREDFAQEALIHLHRQLSAFRFRSRFRHWARIVIRNFVYDRLRALRAEMKEEGGERHSDERREEGAARNREAGAATNWVEDAILVRERQQALEALLTTLLSDRDLTIVRLSLQKKTGTQESRQKRTARLTDADIARAVGLNPNSVPKTRERIFRRLAQNPLLRELVAELFGEDFLD